ncbi:MAG: hypothetical protein NVS1B11_15340 [Terriglobales bacterium]
MLRRYWIALLCTLALCTSLHGQTAQAPTVTFSIDFPGAVPDHYVLSVSSDGTGTYESSGDAQAQPGPSDPYRFAISTQATKRIFDLTAKADHFAKKVDSDKNVAFTGTKTLTYRDISRTTKATYNYSSVPPIQMLTGIFQRLSTTLEFGRRLDYDYRYQKLALEAELKRMEQMQRDNDLEGLEAISPILEKIANDASLMNISRARAQRLIADAGK